MVDEWNRLSSHVVNAPSIGSFKNRLDRFMEGVELGLEGVVQELPRVGYLLASCSFLKFLCSY